MSLTSTPRYWPPGGDLTYTVLLLTWPVQPSFLNIQVQYAWTQCWFSPVLFAYSIGRALPHRPVIAALYLTFTSPYFSNKYNTRWHIANSPCYCLRIVLELFYLPDLYLLLFILPKQASLHIKQVQYTLTHCWFSLLLFTFSFRMIWPLWPNFATLYLAYTSILTY